MKLLNLDFTRIAHDTFRIAGSKVVYTDPYKVDHQDKADVVLISHDHFDHLSLEDLQKVWTPKTVVIASASCCPGLKGLKVAGAHFLAPGEKVTVDKLDDMTVVIKKTSPSKKAKASTHFASWLKSFMNENGEILDELADR